MFFIRLGLCVLFQLMSPLNQEQAYSARDALSKAVYARTFSWLVNKINDSLSVHNILLILSLQAWPNPFFAESYNRTLYCKVV